MAKRQKDPRPRFVVRPRRDASPIGTVRADTAQNATTLARAMYGMGATAVHRGPLNLDYLEARNADFAADRDAGEVML